MRAIGSVLIEQGSVLSKDLRPGLKPPEEGGGKGGKGMICILRSGRRCDGCLKE